MVPIGNPGLTLCRDYRRLQACRSMQLIDGVRRAVESDGSEAAARKIDPEVRLRGKATMKRRNPMLRALPVILLVCSPLPAVAQTQFSSQQGVKLVGTGVVGSTPEQGTS